MSYTRIATEQVQIVDRTAPGSKELWDFEIHELGGVTASDPIGIEGSPVFISGSKGNDPLYPFNPLQIQFTIRDEHGLREKLKGRRKRDFKLVVKDGSTTLYELFLYLPSRNYEYYEEASSVDLIATTGIGFLEDEPYSAQDVTVELKDFLSDIFQALGLEFDIHFYSEWQSGDNKHTFPLGYRLNEQDFARFKEGEELPSYLEVLRNFCDKFNLQLYQDGTTWTFIERRMRINPSANLAGVQLSDGSVLSRDWKTALNADQVSEKPAAEFKPGLKEFKSKFLLAGPIFINPDFQDSAVETNEVPGWELSGDDSLVLSDEYGLYPMLRLTDSQDPTPYIRQKSGQVLTNITGEGMDTINISFETAVFNDGNDLSSIQYFIARFYADDGTEWILNDSTFTWVESDASFANLFYEQIEDGGLHRVNRDIHVNPPTGKRGLIEVEFLFKPIAITLDATGYTAPIDFNISFNLDTPRGTKTTRGINNQVNSNDRRNQVIGLSTVDNFGDWYTYEYLNDQDQWVNAPNIFNDPIGDPGINPVAVKDRLAMMNAEELEYSTLVTRKHYLPDPLQTVGFEYKDGGTLNLIPLEYKWNMGTGEVEFYGGEAIYDDSGITIEEVYGDEDSESGSSPSTASTGSGGGGATSANIGAYLAGVEAVPTAPITVQSPAINDDFIIGMKFTNKFQLNGSGELDLPQPIAQTSSPTFGGITLNGNANMGSNRIVSLADPINNQDAATKKYVDDNSVTDHGELTGLADDDHSQYLHTGITRNVTAVHNFANGMQVGGNNFVDGSRNLIANSYAVGATGHGFDSSGNVSGGTGNFSGLVGIGTTSPQRTLHINNGSYDNHIIIQRGSDYGFLSMGGDNLLLGASKNTSSKFTLYVNANGNVGIDDSSPSYKLTVNGTGRFTGNLTADSNMLVSGYAQTKGGFASGFAGYGTRVDYANNSITTNDITARGRMSIYELMVNQLRATNGSRWVSSGAKIDSVSDQGGGVWRCFMPESQFVPFLENDLVRAQRFTGAGTYLLEGEVIAVNNGSITITDNSSPRYFDITLESGSNAPAAGMELVRIGNTSDPDRQGAVYLTADDDGAPYIDIIDGVDSHSAFQTARTHKSRFGNLSDITDPTFGQLKGYGSYIQNLYATGNAQIAGTLTAGDANGVGNTFYAGRIRKNLLKSSEFDSDWALGSNITQVSGSSPDPTGGNNAKRYKVLGGGNAYVRVSSNLTVSEGETYTLSVWARIITDKAGTGRGRGSWYIRWWDGSNQLGTSTINSTSKFSNGWLRLGGTVTVPSGADRAQIHAPFIDSEPDFEFDLFGIQFEEGEIVTTYQPTDGTILSSDTGFGMWATRGGFGGTIQNPAVQLSNAGMRVRSAVSQTNVPGNGSYIGNFKSAAGFYGTILNETGLYGYQNNTMVMRIDNVGAMFGGWNVTGGSIRKETTTGAIEMNSSFMSFRLRRKIEGDLYTTVNIQDKINFGNGSVVESQDTQFYQELGSSYENEREYVIADSFLWDSFDNLDYGYQIKVYFRVDLGAPYTGSDDGVWQPHLEIWVGNELYASSHYNPYATIYDELIVLGDTIPIHVDESDAEIYQLNYDIPLKAGINPQDLKFVVQRGRTPNITNSDSIRGMTKIEIDKILPAAELIQGGFQIIRTSSAYHRFSQGGLIEKNMGHDYENVIHTYVDSSIQFRGGVFRINGLPDSSSGLPSGHLYTQTATQLGGSGSEKVLCVA